MQNVPEICISICGAWAVLALAALPVLMRLVRRAPLRNDWA